MSMGSQFEGQQEDLWVATTSLAQSPGHPFYERLGRILKDHGFDAMAEAACAKFYADGVGRPSTPPGVYFRMLFIGFFEGIDSERGIAWRTADSMALRAFLGYGITVSTPDHSNLSRTRHRIDLETHQQVFDWVLTVLAQEGLLKGKTLGIDATTLEANAALRSIVRRDTGENYDDFLDGLAKASGIQTPTREDRAKIDKNRPGKGSNKDWKHPHDPDARIAKMKDGRTHLAHKAEHAVDMETGALVAVTLQTADLGDTTTVYKTLTQAQSNMHSAAQNQAARKHIKPLREAVTDKGYHSNETVQELDQTHHLRTYISEPNRGRRTWDGKPEAQQAVYANRRRIRGERGKALMRKRGELVERSFAHAYETGGMRRTHLRGHENILKRLLIHTAGFNLSLILRKTMGIGTARGMQDRVKAALLLLLALWHGLWRPVASQSYDHPRELPENHAPRTHQDLYSSRAAIGAFATGC
jgi:transposase